MEDSNIIFESIFKGLGKCTKAGIKPAEVWLGPREVDMLWFDLHKNDPNPIEKELIATKLKGASIYGLPLRFMVEDGVRIGKSFSVDI